MTDEPTSGLPAATVVNSGDLIDITQAGVSKKATYSLFQTNAFGTPGFTRFVDNANGSDSNNGLSWTTAYQTHTHALSALSGADKGDIFFAGGFQGFLSAQTVWPESISLHGNHRPATVFDAFDNGTWFEWNGSNPGSAGLTTGSIFRWPRFDRGQVIENIGMKIPGTMPNLRVFDMVNWQNMPIIRGCFVKGDNYASAFCAYNTLSLGAPGYFEMDRCWMGQGAARPFLFGGGVENILMTQCGCDDGNSGSTSRVQSVVTVGPTGISGEVYPGGSSLALTLLSCKNEMGGTTTGDFPFVETAAGGSGYDALISMFGCIEQSNFTVAGGLTTPTIRYLATPSQPDDKLPVCVKGMTSQSRAHLVTAPNASPPITFNPTTTPASGHRTRWNSPESWLAP